ncbi:MAG: FHA domain-containing protein [Planctomycetes bacterium]|nr:FHA domain-containing protein [Planctomycetota bacterium]
MPSLRLEIGGGATKTFALRDGDLVGRVKGVAIVLAHESVSRKHAAIHIDGERVEVEDLGSSNGTFVNERQIVRQSLAPGDRVRFGRVALRFEAGDEGLVSAAEPSAGEPSVGEAAATALRADFGADDWADDDELLLPGDAPAPVVAEPRIEMRARPSAEAPRPMASAATGTVEEAPRQRVLQYRKVEAGGGLLAQDLSQWGWFARVAAIVVVLALSAGLFLLARWMGSGFSS